MEKIFLRLVDIQIEFPDGFVVGITEFEHVTEGWVVGLKGATDFEGDDGLRQAVTIARKTSGLLRGSKEGELTIWDVVMIFQDEEMATEAGHDNDQLFIYQIETQKLKWLV